MPAPKNKKSLKQGSLFSFFSAAPGGAKKATPKKQSTQTKSTSSKANNNNDNNSNKKETKSKNTKPKTKPSSTDSASPVAVSPSDAQPQSQKSNAARQATSPQKKTRNTLWQQVQVGHTLLVFWPNDKQYYKAVVKSCHGKSRFTLEYEDGEVEQLDLSTEQFKFLSKTVPSNKNSNSKKRLQIDDDDDDEEEMEWDDEQEEEEDDDGSVYEAKDQEEDDDEEEADQWMVTDNEDNDYNDNEGEEEPLADRPKKKRKTTKAALKVTTHRTSSSSSHTPTSKASIATKTPPKSASSSSSSTFFKPGSLQQFANTVSPLTTHTTPTRPAIAPRKLASTTPPKSSSSTTSKAAGNNTNKTKALPFQKGVVNPRGAHVHNHLQFVQNPRDSMNRGQDDPDYDPRTLKVDENEWNRVYDGKMTNAVKQWWELKSRYFDTVLLFKTGKFYEMFHMDADIGVEVCGFIYMKGHVAHSGFPEISYGQMADKLVRAGYKVARVEQTETPEALKVRKANTPKGQSKPQVVNREVCSILTLGTRTFCCLDDVNALANSETNGSGVGPLLAIQETLLEQQDGESTMQDSEEDNDDEVKPVCEYGITLVDAVNGAVTIGQFADDVLRSRMSTLLTSFAPSEILLSKQASPTLKSQIKVYQTNSRNGTRVEVIADTESFPQSTALEHKHRAMLQRKTSHIHPWDIEETMAELHRRGYYPRGSKHDKLNTSRWPKMLQAAIDGKAQLLLQSFGAILFYLQRNLIDQEILSMGIVKAYLPPPSSCINQQDQTAEAVLQQHEEDEPMANTATAATSATPVSMSQSPGQAAVSPLGSIEPVQNAEGSIKNMSLDGTTLHNLEILTNAVDHKATGSLWSKINYTKTPHGARLLRAWLLRPLFQKGDIERRADAVQELVAGAGAVALNEARQNILSKIGDLDRLLSRLHSMSGPTDHSNENAEAYHPGERAVLYESATYNKRKVGDFSKLLNGLRRACQIPELFADLELQEGGQLKKIVRQTSDGGFFPCMVDEIDWYFDNFDCEKAAKGDFEPARGCDQAYDEACDTIERIKAELDDHKREMCAELRQNTKHYWKYVNVKPDSKDKYLIELPADVNVPGDFQVKGKRGKGAKQINKYRTSFVAGLVHELERAFEVQKDRKAKGMQLIFARFNKQRSLWAAAAQTTAMLDALGSLAKTAGKAGFCRPTILDCSPNEEPTINIVQGRHPCVESSINSDDFIPNDLTLGRKSNSERLLLLSGPNMGGKSTLLRQTCLIAILAQIGSFVPAESCELTPIDCIFTRLGASDRILLGQSTFFVELAETASALRGATRRSLVIMDELGRGTSTFDGTAIAGATVKHLVERSQCLSLFATHYHSLLNEWEHEPKVRLGHMECMVEDGEEDAPDDSRVTFLYTLGPGTCPKSFGINVARLAGLPQQVLVNAKRVSEEFEAEMNDRHQKKPRISSEAAVDFKQKITDAIQSQDWDSLRALQNELKASA
ncbi:unnamed protein product [Cylindrotheca closterium]|uniref:DNA mismatch repair protein n=1 Tax=Cylindrotheca closterium TaxID=2856 RepID=A0AAD2FWI3_9STRA|nr:unnamed protein product [Cylindrotheca closterium]